MSVIKNKVLLGYFAPWEGLKPESVPYKKLTHINFAFGSLRNKSDPADIQFDDSNRKLLCEIKKNAAKHGVKVLISIGGWTGAPMFSTMIKTFEMRRRFIENALNFVSKEGFDLDGIDLDWEYPNLKGVDCDNIDSNDTANFCLLVKELRNALFVKFPKVHKLITAAVYVLPFFGPEGKPEEDLSPFANIFDYISIMAYDITNMNSNTTGPNAPLDNPPNVENNYSLSQSVKAWMKVGFPSEKIVAGLPFYGRSFTSLKDMSNSPDFIYVDKEKTVPRGDSDDGLGKICPCKEDLSYSGVFKYKNLRKEILLDSPYKPSKNYTRFWDTLSQTPWLFDSKRNHYISYDDPKSLKIKVDYAKTNNLLGVMYWEMSHDYNDELLDVLYTIHDSF